MFERMEREMEEFRRQMLGAFPAPIFGRIRPMAMPAFDWAPAADAYEQDGSFVVKAELPGVKKEDVAVSVEGGMLTITGRRAEETENKDARFYTAERFAGEFRRSFALPEGVDPDTIEATFMDGVLEVRAPLPAASGPEVITIPVKS
jgi:HSP20 family protein